MKKIKTGVVGIGNMGSHHVRFIMDGKVKHLKLVSVCDIDDERLNWAKESYPDLKRYKDYNEMMESGEIEAVIVATPHLSHCEIAIKGFENNLHVLIEKPAGVYTKQVRVMNEASKKTDRVFGIMYNQRTNPLYRKVKELIESGDLGEIKRVIWIVTNWYRSQSYYDSGGWRATWEGEGGGVLLNQDPHQLDLWQWMCGMPIKVRAFMGFGKYHNIEVEDDVTAYVEYENGASGLFVTSTGEAPGTNRLEISADRGKVVVEDGKIIFHRNAVGERQFNRENKKGFGAPECWKCEINPNGEETGHVGILIDWADSILNKTPLLAPGVDGIKGLEISNAMHLSKWTDSTVTLPINEELFKLKLDEMIKNSTFKKNSENVTLDVDGSF